MNEAQIKALLRRIYYDLDQKQRSRDDELRRDIRVVFESQQARINDLAEIVKELSTQINILYRKTRNEQISTDKLNERYDRWAQQLAQMISMSFNSQEMYSLAADLNVHQSDVLTQDTKTGKAYQLAAHFQRRRTLDILAEACQLRRPMYQWPLNIVDVDIS